MLGPAAPNGLHILYHRIWMLGPAAPKVRAQNTSQIQMLRHFDLYCVIAWTARMSPVGPVGAGGILGLYI